MLRCKVFRSAAIFCLMTVPIQGLAITIDQYDARVGAEVDFYAGKGELPSQDYRSNVNFFFQSKFLWDWNQGENSLSFAPYLRIDQRDHDKSYADIRELLWTRSEGNWSLNMGIGKVFWGVTEFNHLVDVINQTDLVANINGEEKLGQSMVNLSVIKPWGALDLFILPGFRERTFAGENGRLRTLAVVDADNVRYESPDKDQHIDFAIRWSNTFKHFDLGIFMFDGTNREPVLEIQPISAEIQNTHLTAHTAIANYQQMTQLGIDYQGVFDNWLLKLEALWRKTSQERYGATQLGIEYTIYNINNRPVDVGLLLEYGWDERGKASSSIVQSDLFVASRVSFNDFDSTELLVGMAYDQDFYSYSAFLEFTQSMSQNSQLSVEARLFKAENPEDYLYNIAGDDYIKLTFEYFF